MKLTKANITRVLKAAGFKKSEEIRSRQVRGYVRSSDGFRIEEATFSTQPALQVFHTAAGTVSMAHRAYMNERYAQALQVLFFVVLEKSHGENRVLVWDRATDRRLVRP